MKHPPEVQRMFKSSIAAFTESERVRKHRRQLVMLAWFISINKNNLIVKSVLWDLFKKL